MLSVRKKSQWPWPAVQGFHLEFANGWTVSVQFGVGNYCEHYKKFADETFDPKGTSNDAEIAAWDAEGNWYLFPGDEDASTSVRGYQNADEVAQFIVKVQQFPRTCAEAMAQEANGRYAIPSTE